MIVEDFSIRLRKAMNYRNMKQIDLSNKTGIDKSLISNYLSGNYKAKQDKLYELAKALNVNEAWLMGFDVSMDRNPILNVNIDNAKLEPLNSQVVKIPVLGKVPAGIPIEAIQDIIGYEDIPADWVKHGEKYFALKVYGNSMYPDYHDNDTIIVKQQPDCNSGQDCIVMVNGDDATFKRVVKQNNSIILKPLNNEYEPYYFNQNEIISKPVKIIGIAVEVRRKLR